MKGTHRCVRVFPSPICCSRTRSLFNLSSGVIHPAFSQRGSAIVSDETSIDFQELEGETELVPVEDYGDNLIEWAVERQVSDIFISDDQLSVTVTVRRLGRVQMVRRLARGYGNRLQGYFRALAGADTGDIIHPAEGRGTVGLPGGQVVDFRLSSLPTLLGQDVSLRLFNSAWANRGIGALGMDADVVELLKRLLNHSSGVILVSGPVASGKTSTLYSAINELNDGTRKIHTLEDPVEHVIAGVNQSQINLKAGVDFSDLLTTVLRHSPDVIMIGEIRDTPTAATAIRAGGSGQLVLATVHSDSAAEAIDTMRQYEINRTFLARTLIGVINQRLIRRLCPECRQEISSAGVFVENPHVVNRLGDTIPKLYRAVGCDACMHTGFDTLTCLTEVMVADRDLEQAIVAGLPAGQLHQMATAAGMVSLAESAQARVLRGETTAAEALRVLDDEQLHELAALAHNAEADDRPAAGCSPYG